MLITPQLIDIVTRFEGFQPEIYKCPAGIDTIGYGHTRSAVMPIRVTKEEALELLRQDLAHFVDVVLDLVTVPLNQNQFAALVSFAFNLGEANLRGSTLLDKLNQGDYAGAADEFQKWDNAGGRPLRGLTRRRGAEEQLFRTPPGATTDLQLYDFAGAAQQIATAPEDSPLHEAAFIMVVPQIPLILKTEEEAETETA